MSPRIRIVVIDDSALMRQMVSRILTETGFEVVATARDGHAGLQAIRRHAPDVVTLDVEMPNMDGLTMLRHVMKEKPLPVVMLSTLTAAQAPAAIEALALGAVDVVGKPGGGISLNIADVAGELIRKVKVAATARISPIRPESSILLRTKKEPLGQTLRRPGEECLVVIGTSTGGPGALAEIVSRLPGHFPWPMVVVQHMPAGFTASLAQRLDRLNASFSVVEARSGVAPKAGSIWVAPGGRHLIFDSMGRMQIDDGPPHLGVRPAVDVTMESAVDYRGNRVVGVVLTGMGMDGARGARRIQEAGGLVLAQDKATSVVYGMPRVVVEMGSADEVLPIEKMAGRLDELARPVD